MKESTKNRLKKFGKVTAYGLGLFAMFLLGVGLGNCSANDKPVKAQAVEGSSFADHKTLKPKRALDPADWRTLGDNPDNLLLDAEAGHYGWLYSEDGGVAGYRLPDDAGLDLYLLELLPSTRYYVSFSYGGSERANVGDYRFLNEYGAEQVHKRMNGEPSQRVFVEASDVSSGGSIYGDGPAGSFFFVVPSTRSYLLLRLSNLPNLNVSIVLYDIADLSKFPTLTSIDLGEFYNPLPIIGQTINDASIIVYPSAGAEVNVAPVDFVSSNSNSFLFVSSGNVFDGFRIELMRVMNVEGSQVERYATKSGETMIAPAMALNYVTANAFYYRLASSSQWVKVWELPYNGTDQGYNYWSYNGRWLSSTFRYVDVKMDGGATGLSSWLPTFTLSDLLALNVWTAGALILGDAYNNVFTMLGKGFEAVGGLLSIQILPYLSLGTLIFVPLVVLIIFAILRILNK